MKQSKMQTAYELIKQKILTGEYKEGQIIYEEMLQKQFNISRTPIREGIKRLESERHVIIFPRKGTIVASIDLKLINNVYQVRQMVEPYVMKYACLKVSKEWLKDIKQKFMDTNENYNVDTYISVDREFHKTILESMDNVLMEDAMAIVYDHDQRLRIKNSYIEDNYKQSLSEHINIIDAMLNRDVEKAEELMGKHIFMSKQASIKSLIL